METAMCVKRTLEAIKVFVALMSNWFVLSFGPT